MQMDHTWLLYLVAMSLSKMVFALWKMGCYCSVTKSCPIVWTAACQASLSFTIYQSLLKLMSIESMMPSNYPILCHPFSSCPQPFPASESFPMSRIFISGGQSIGASASAIRCMGRCKICFLTSRPLFFPLLYAQEICKPFKKRNRILHKFVSPVKQII